NKGESTQVWFGFVDADTAYYDKYKRRLLKSLIELIGKDFKGELEIKDSQTSLLLISDLQMTFFK
ncbi:hypothetical protein, partial [Helicobacter typhlonius]|uniref:hypothetical protein n=1 Tax=Helicobacter typhlonius TaxID=76936 RepID=UPI002FE2F679